MQERIEALGGRLAIVTAPGQGTTIEARLPSHKDGQAEAGGPDAETLKRAVA
jgi:signal transduction histidine kinase